MEQVYMCIIAALKVGYKLFMARRLLAVYEDKKFMDIDTERKRQKRGRKVVTFGVKSRALDAADILNHTWVFDEKYAKKTSIKNCWKIWDIEIFLF